MLVPGVFNSPFINRLVICFYDNAARYQASMLRSLKEVQADDSVVGFYQATTLGAFFNQTLLDTQAIHQEKLRHGGIIIVHGASNLLIEALGISSSIGRSLQTFPKLREGMPPSVPSD